MSITAPSRELLRSNPEFAAEYRRTLLRAAAAKNPGRTYATPGELAATIDPATIQTPALTLIDEALVWAYETPGARLIISMPPQEGKSERATKTGTLWALLQNPERRIGVVSYGVDLARIFGRDIRNWVQDNSGQDGSLDLRLRIASDNGSATDWQLDGHRGGVVVRGVGGGLTGRPLDALVIDDPFADDEQAQSEAYREKVWQWWLKVGSTRLAPGAPVIVIMTRWHEDDLAGRLLKAAKEEGAEQWRYLNIQAIAEFDPEKGETDPLSRQPGEWMVSARGRTALEWVTTRIRLGSKAFGALYQGVPSPDSGTVWKREWWGRYTSPMWQQADYADPLLDVRYVDCDEMLQSWDLTFKDTKGSDYVAGGVWARRGANVYLVDQVRKRMTFTETVAAMVAMSKKWPQASAKLVEDKANGPAVIDTLRDKVGGIIPVEPMGSKYARASAVSPYIESTNVILPAQGLLDDFDLEGFLTEASAFPNGTHDDQVDQTSQALARLYINGAAAWIDFMRKRAAGTLEQQQAAVELAEAEAIVESEKTPEQRRADARQAAFQNSSYR